MNSTLRLASESSFPFGWPDIVAYFTIDETGPVKLHTRDQMRAAVRSALKGETTIYAAWPGRFRTDLFLIDNVAELAAAIGVSE